MSATATRPAPSHARRSARPPRSPGRGGGGRSPGWGVLRTEALRTGPAAYAAALVVVAAGILATELLLSTGWSTTFAGSLVWVDNAHYFWGPLAAALGAWVAGRERRRGMGELLAATSRPAWQRVRLTWTAVVLGVVAGVLGQTALVVAAGLPAISYGGGRWLPTLVVLVLGMVVHAAVGFALGRVVPGRLVAPAVGVAGFLCILAVNTDPVLRRMWPVGGLYLQDGQQLRADVLGLLVVWLLSLTGVALLVALGRRRVLAVVPLVVAVAAAVPLVATAASTDDPWTVDDPAAQAMVCTTDAGPQVCVQQVHAGLLEAVTPLARQQLAEADPVVVWSSAQETSLLRTDPLPDDVLGLPSLDEEGRAFGSGLADAREYLALSVSYQSTSACYAAADPAAQAEQDAVTGTADTVAEALLTDSDQGLAQVPGASGLHQRLVADPGAAKTWMEAYRLAAPECDLPELTRLVGA